MNRSPNFPNSIEDPYANGYRAGLAIAAARIETLEAALRMIDTGVSLGTDFVIDKTEHSMLTKIQRIARVALAKGQDK